MRLIGTWHGRDVRRGIAVALMIIVGALPAAAQLDEAADFLSIERPGERELEALDPEAPESEWTLPPIPAPTPAELGKSLSEDQLEIRSLELRGNTAIETAALEAAAQPFLGQTLDAEGVEALRRRLTEVYVDAGYVNSGAVIPAQAVQGGQLVVEIVEGYVAEIRIVGLTHYRERIVRERIARGIRVPFRMDALEQQLRILDQDPRIQRIAAQLRPGAARHEAILEISLEETDPRHLELSTDNHAAPSAGAFAGRLSVGHSNVVGLGDGLWMELDLTEGLTTVSGRYDIPVHPSGTHLFFDGAYGRAELVNNPFRSLEIESESSSLGFGVAQPLWHTPSDWVELSLSFERRRTKTMLLGRSFSFAPGPENGRSEASVLRGTAEWRHRGASSVLALRSVLSLGVDLFDPTIQSSDAPDGLFLSWIGQLRGVYRLRESGVLFRLRSDLQLADRPLLSLEQFALGGATSVRGYRRNQLVRDQGFAAALDVQVPVWRNASGETRLSLGPFVDFGTAWNEDRETPGIRTLSSVGVGFEWSPLENLEFSFEYAYPFRDADTSGDLQDKSIFFRGVWRAF